MQHHQLALPGNTIPETKRYSMTEVERIIRYDGRRCVTKKEIGEHWKRIRDSGTVNAIDCVFLHSAIRLHPKIAHSAVVISRVYVGVADGGSPCIRAVVDGIDNSFGYQACADAAFYCAEEAHARRHTSKRNERARLAIRPQVCRYKAECASACTPMPSGQLCVKCALCGITQDAIDKCDVDHAGHFPFDRIYNEFLLLYPGATFEAEDATTPVFCTYHAERWCPQVLCKSCHYAKSGCETSARAAHKRTAAANTQPRPPKSRKQSAMPPGDRAVFEGLYQTKRT